MPRAVIVVKTKSDLDSINVAITQWDQMAFECGRRNIEIVDRILTTGGIKDIQKKIEKLDKLKQFDYVVLYSPNQFADKRQDYIDFVGYLDNFFGVKVVAIRS
ncbi:MAG: hypothetical protein ACK5MV_08540 [Aminipila sp.]